MSGREVPASHFWTACRVGQTLLAQPRLFAQVIETLLKFHGCDLQNKWLQRTFDAVQDSKEFPVLQPKVGYNLTTSGCSGRFSTKNGRKMIFRPFLLCGDQRLCMDR